MKQIYNEPVINVGILEDNAALRQSMETYLSMKVSYKVVFSTGKPSDILEQKKITPPDFILLDEHLGDTQGSAFIKYIKKRFERAVIIMITGDDSTNVLMKAIEEGAEGFLYKPFRMEHLDTAINQIIESGSFLQSKATTKLLQLLNRTRAVGDKRINLLTEREKEIAQLIFKGCTYKEAAEALHVTMYTVNYHMKNIYLKLNVKTKGQLFNFISNNIL